MSVTPPFVRIGLGIVLPAMACTAAFAQVSGQGTEVARVVRHELDADSLAYRVSLIRCRPPVRGFRVCLSDPRWNHWPLNLPGEESTPIIRQAVLHVAQHLADEGLLATTAKVMAMISPIAGTMDDEQLLSLLKTVGLPVDLLGYFQLGSSSGSDALDTLRELRRLLSGGRLPAESTNTIAHARFAFRATNPRFRACAEGRPSAIGLVRLQLSSADYWRGPGDGSGIDIAGQLLRNLPGSQFLIAIDSRNLPRLLSQLEAWQLVRSGQIVVSALPEATAKQTLDQWAQDTGKPGVLEGEAGVEGQWATILPRYISRGEESTIFDPASAFVGDMLSKAGHMIVESPLLFQGGNVLVARQPSTGKRILLIGEAEVCRNIALGLTSRQAIDALRIEMGADDAAVLPAVSFHLDFEIGLREQRGELLAFVNDSKAAARHIARLGAAALGNAGALSSDAGKKASQLTNGGHDDQFVNEIAPAVMKLVGSTGVFPATSAKYFSSGPVDNGAANLERFLLAMDLLACGTADQPLPAEPFAQAYIGALRQRDADRAMLHARLAELGCRVVAVPSSADEDRSVNYVNALHEQGRVFMPAYAGFLAPIDEAAADAYRRALGADVAVVPVFSAESQRRLGAVHCSAAIYPRQ